MDEHPHWTKQMNQVKAKFNWIVTILSKLWYHTNQIILKINYLSIFGDKQTVATLTLYRFFKAALSEKYHLKNVVSN